MRDPYLYEDMDILRNQLNIRDTAELNKAEALITCVRLLDVDGALKQTQFDINHLCAIHRFIFGDLFDWAGQLRTIPMVKGERVLGGDTVRYSHPEQIKADATKAIQKLNAIDWATLSAAEISQKFAKLIAELWQVHPFREGNTRTVITFAAQFAAAHGFALDKNLLRENASYVRDALVKASDGPYSDYQYLRKIFKDAILHG